MEEDDDVESNPITQIIALQRTKKMPSFLRLPLPNKWKAKTY